MRFILLMGCALYACVPFQALAADDQIIVTAKRIEQNAQDYAGRVDVLSGERLELINSVHPAESLNAIAGVNIHRGSGQEHLTAIRSPVLTGGAGAGSFLYLEDGVPLRAAGFANVNGLFEAGSEFARRIEVQKGPGSVLYGSNAVHGLINVISESPERGGKIKLTGSDDGFASLEASLSNDTLRASLSLAHDNGFRADSGFDQQKVQVRADKMVGIWDATWLTNYQNLNQETAGFIQGEDAYKDDAIRFTNPNPEAFRDGESLRTQLRLDRSVGINKTLSLTPYARWTELRFLRHFVPGQALEKNGHISGGLLASISGNNFIAGIDAEYTDGFLYEFQDNPNRFSFVQGLHYDYEVQSTVVAAYAQRDFALGPKTSLDIGARAEFTGYNYHNNADSVVTGRFKRVDDRDDDFFTVTPKVGITYDLTPDVTLYGRVARGSRAPQTTDLYAVQDNQEPGDADVETLDTLEAGVKGQLGGFDFDVTGYAMRKENFFFRNSQRRNVTDGKTKHYGVELSASGPLTHWLSIGGDVSLASHTYDFDEAPSGIVSGNDVDTAPNTLANARLTARPTGGILAEIEWRHMGEYFTNPANTQSYGGHDIFVLRGEVEVMNQAHIFGRVDNVFDTRYADRADFAFGNERYFPGRPRTVFFGVKSDF